MRIPNYRQLSCKSVLFVSCALFGLAPLASPATIGYTSTLSLPGSAVQAGEPSIFHLPYTPNNGSQTVTTSQVGFTLGSFITDAFGVGSPSNPNVSATNIQIIITPTVNAVAQSPLTFWAEITNPATNVFCFDVNTTNSFNASLNCQSSNPGTFAAENFDGLYSFGIESYTLINSVTKTTNLLAFCGPAVPEPATVGLTGLALVIVGGFALRRKLQPSRS